MESQNDVQVQWTNDACAVSKYSAVRKNYFEDDFIKHFVPKKKNRAPLIHAGYYARAIIMTKIVKRFINFLLLKKILKFQIISCGSGFDTTYWRLSKDKIINQNVVFVEIDFPAVIKKKIDFISRSQIFKSFMKETCFKKSTHINQMNSNHFLLEADLNDIDLIERLFDKIHINYSVPTLFLSECVITYMEVQNSEKLIHWMGTKFENSALLNYEQIHPEDGFGEIMLRHFIKLQSPLFSVLKYPDLKSHQIRYKNLGFENSCVVSEWDAFVSLTNNEERKKAFSLELFDEFEEFHMKCFHYVIAIAGNKILSDWIKHLYLSSTNNSSLNKIMNHLNGAECNIQLYKQSSCKVNNDIYMMGGYNHQCRSDKIFRFNCKGFSKYNPFKIQPVECLKDDSVQLDAVHASLSHFVLDQIPYICLFGGRRSPDKICNNGAAVVFEVNKDKLIQKIMTVENPFPRYRTTLTSLNKSDSEAHCWVFGGRSSDLNTVLSDLWELTLKHDKNQNLIHKWKKYEKRNENWPCGRMSHGCIACPKRNAVFVAGGLDLVSGYPLSDLWMWCCRTESWQKLKLNSKLTSRYGHTAHLTENEIYLVGGISPLGDQQPSLARIDLIQLTVTEYLIQPNGIEPFLIFNHSSELIGQEEDAEILIFGGGGNCFSFGTHLNEGTLRLKLDQLASSSPSKSLNET